MKILSIDTASNICTVAILENQTCIKEIIVNDARNHSEKIMPIIQQIFEETNLSLDNIDLIVCDKGPGSFTGIRIGVGTVLAFKDSREINCIGVSSLEALAYNVKQNGLICSLIDARNDNVYYGLFKLENNQYKQISELDFKNINKVIDILKSENNKIYFVGDGALANQELLQNSIENCEFSDKNDLSSYSLGIAGYNKFINNELTDVMPLYLRKSQAEREHEKEEKI